MSECIIDLKNKTITLKGTFTGYNGKDYKAIYRADIENNTAINATGHYFDDEINDWVRIEDCATELGKELTEKLGQ